MPLKAVYSLSSELYFRPCIGSYELSMEPFNWRSAENSGLVQISCPDIQKGFSACYFNIEAEVEKIFFESGEEKNAKSFFFHLQPTVILHNLLPFTISYLLEGTADHESLTKGENRPLMHACFTETTLGIVIPSYQNEEWMGCCQIQCNTPLLTTCSFEAGPESNRASLDLGLHCKLNKGTLDVSLFCPYWMINKTGKWLAYRGSDQSSVVQHPPDAEALVLFSYKRKSFFSAKKKDKEEGKHEGEKKSKDKVHVMKQAGKAQLQIENLEWSDKFSLDTVGSSGTVQCRSKTEEAEVGVKIYLSSSGLTKVVTFTPYYLLLNISTESILITDHENWIEVPSQQVIPFYPYPSENITIKAKIKGTSEETVPFPIDQAHSTMLRLDNEYGAICAECQVTESSMITTLKGYSPGLAAVRVVNHIENFSVTFYQCGLKDCQVTVPSQHTVLYTWDLPMGVREIVWSCGNKRNVKNNLSEDDMDEFFADDDTKVYWVTFLDGLQRVLLFTEDLEIAVEAQEAGELEHVEKELLFQLQSFGLSLVNDLTQEELAFLGITSSGIIWEEKKKRRYKALKLKDCKMLEEAYQKYHNDLVVGKIPNITVQLENKMEVDFSSMTAVKPRTFPIRRIFENGIWFNFKSSAHQQQLHAKINRLQFDNQMAHAIFPTVLSPVAPPKTVAADSAPKSFIEVSLMMRMHEHSNVSQIKYFKVLVQEMNVKVSQEFLNAVLDFLAPTEPLPRIQETIQFLEDIKLSEKSLMNLVGLSLSEEQKNFYDYLHLSPLKIHLSFSLQNSSGSTETMELHAGVLNVFLQSVGVVLTDIQDVVFKLGYFERSHACYNQSQLIREVSRHYIGQAIKQTYVLVLGLDVLGNPFGLLRGLSEGIEDLFYEPYQGAIQGPEEFAEGLALGVRSLFGHTVGGAAGAVSRITGTLGKGLASLTLDEEYQKKRQAQLNKRPATATEGFARGGKGLVMGVFDGVTGIVRKPVEGARQEGVSGFFKGVGKGLVGVVTRPTSGVVDFASSSFEGIRRITEMTDEIKRLRPARRFYKDGVIRPYVHQEAEGYEVLKETDKGKFIATDEYQAHVVVSKDGKNIFLLTDKRIIMAKLGEIFGSWDCEWSYTWAELKEPPKRIPKGIEIILKEKEKKKFFSGGASKKEVTITDPIIVEWILLRIEEQMTRNR
ncbi:vacuolar protein sorting-associated protein 13C-like [Pomacea canaliculata]|uniref:vacuolar protein sorting-associated protein 13C-like n=1 Tax=Pomacea canaliculata TaxID=400727 RepID=UPI000D733C83|nr:vacuolar protein sorting-associated protein 13C-like [Pomacea canaliculata]